MWLAPLFVLFVLNAPLVGFLFCLLHHVQLMQEKHSVKFHWQIVIFVFLQGSKEGTLLSNLNLSFYAFWLCGGTTMFKLCAI